MLSIIEKNGLECLGKIREQHYYCSMKLICQALLTKRNFLSFFLLVFSFSVIYGSILFVDLTAFYAEALWGEIPSPNMWIFTAGKQTQSTVFTLM